MQYRRVFTMITLNETLLRFLPRGAHDPARFIRPGEMRHYLEANGFTHVSDFIGMGIVGLNQHFEFRFGLTGSTQVMYIGHAK